MILGHELYGSQSFVDTKNNMRAVINYGPSGHVGMRIYVCKFFCCSKHAVVNMLVCGRTQHKKRAALNYGLSGHVGMCV